MNVEIPYGQEKILIKTKEPYEVLMPNKVIIEDVLMIKEVAAALADSAGYGQLWVKNTTPCELWFTDDAGTDTQIV